MSNDAREGVPLHEKDVWLIGNSLPNSSTKCYILM